MRPAQKPAANQSTVSTTASFPRCFLIDAVLVQDEVIDLARGVLMEGELGVDNFEEEITLGFRKDLEAILAGELRKDSIAFTRDGNDYAGRQFIFAGVLIESCGIDFYDR